MKYLVSSLFLIFLSGVTIADDYSIVDSSIQSFPAKGITEIEISCFCSNDVKIKRTKRGDIKIEIEAKMDSVGYHGKQTKPKGISKTLLNFESYTTDERLELVSKEYTFMHHAFVIKKLTVYLPKNVRYRLMPIHYFMLKGRNSEN